MKRTMMKTLTPAIAAMVKQDIPEIGVKPAGAGSSGSDSGDSKPPSGDKPENKKSEKGCATGGADGAWLLAFVGLVLAVRRRRR